MWLEQIQPAYTASFMPGEPTRAVHEAATVQLGEETRKSLRAMRRAYADTILENLAWGLPIIQWREGRGVVEVPAEQLAPFARRILETNGEPLPPTEERELLKHLKI